MPIYVVGDFNVRLDRPDYPHAKQLRQLVDCYGLELHCTGRHISLAERWTLSSPTSLLAVLYT